MPNAWTHSRAATDVRQRNPASHAHTHPARPTPLHSQTPRPSDGHSLRAFTSRTGSATPNVGWTVCVWFRRTLPSYVYLVCPFCFVLLSCLALILFRFVILLASTHPEGGATDTRRTNERTLQDPLKFGNCVLSYQHTIKGE